MAHSRTRADWIGDRTLGAAEGMQYGCWFSPSVGTGVFLPLRRPMFFADRPAVEREMPGVLLFADKQPFIFTSSKNITAAFRHKDCMYASLSRERHVQCLFLMESIYGAAEIVVSTAGCMTRTTPLPTACVPQDVGMRTGW
eukprot:CAMPEP_0174696014 /NCGR_PEP_ID=MMETSP1094-20130205/2268_1 /TAXON_ID=156173 /ORGANISM="Chrysochromulina brevifilum, Strain UTEX LB 985" /LENGTH=140 /DNA_ID=CAMNT_0015892677 /DNA_START=420 /DNA_END=839 /DNA_ORIENTATION=+